MCSTIRPLTLGHYFCFFQGTHVGKTPTSTFYQRLVLPGMVASISRSKGLNCAGLSIPSLWATVLVSFKGPMYGKHQPVPFTRALFRQEWLHQFRDPKVESVCSAIRQIFEGCTPPKYLTDGVPSNSGGVYTPEIFDGRGSVKYLGAVHPQNI